MGELDAFFYDDHYCRRISYLYSFLKLLEHACGTLLGSLCGASLPYTDNVLDWRDTFSYERRQWNSTPLFFVMFQMFFGKSGMFSFQKFLSFRRLADSNTLSRIYAARALMFGQTSSHTQRKQFQPRPAILLYSRGNIALRVVSTSIFRVVMSYFSPRLASSTTRRTTSLVVKPSALASSWSHWNCGSLKVTDCLAMWRNIAPLYVAVN